MELREDDLLIAQGSTWGLIIPVINPDGTAADLTGWEPRAQVRKNVKDSTVLYEWSVDDGNASIEESNVILTVPAPVSSAWTWRQGAYDVEVFNGTQVVRLTQGTIRVDPEVTR